ncbi:hypothetical protein VMCG_06753 [Cytospora schulzeri]|uniref:Uncharacterized protein n=1 Tax=Cytospora schulzeri TaxID=448051 RepID=A0A423W5T3_9PEZI|nr:hypothetical protein VMCG_06753 [Valsa malicola]
MPLTENDRPSEVDASPLHSQPVLANTTAETLTTPLSEISVNVAKVSQAAVREPQNPADDKPDFDASPHWKAMLSPVAEESPSPRKARRNDGDDGDDDDDDVLITFSPRKPPSRSMSPGSIKMQNFLRRLEQQGLSHD